MLIPKVHQLRTDAAVLDAIERGRRRILVTGPTGAGKTLNMGMLAKHYLDRGDKAILYTHRRLLLDQTSAVFDGYGIAHGVRAAGWMPSTEHGLQIASLQTENSRTHKNKQWQIHDAQLVMIDEAHVNREAVAQKIMNAHLDRGAVVVGFTATPLDIGNLYDELIIGSTNSELRAAGMLVKCLHYGPDEPDLRTIGKMNSHGEPTNPGVDLTEKESAKVMMRHGIFGRVLDWWKILNPEQRPTILFAPGVPESIWFAEQFANEGISAAHIDGDDIWLNGQVTRATREARAEILEASKNGWIKVLCNRFVLREGIDAPWLAHGIFATVFGSLQSYLQSGGRLLRSHPSLHSVVLQDHGGNWWRHGSLNADRQWKLGDTARRLAIDRIDGIRERGEPQPARCPDCGMILLTRRCPCGFVVGSKPRSRPVVQEDGSIQMHAGDAFSPKVREMRPTTQTLWTRMIFRLRNAKKTFTFRQAEGLFAFENYYWPPRTLALMPKNDMDWFRAIKEVPFSDLQGENQA